MKEIVISKKEEGQSLHKVLCRVLPEAGSGFLYKMLRKKNITLNDKKADGKEILKVGDSIKIYFADETVKKFMGSKNASERLNGAKGRVDVLYENQDVLIINKPSGILSQKSQESDVSINEEMIQYLINQGALTKEDLEIYRPSICNRLDRNTSGIIICGKTIKGLQNWNRLLHDRSFHKYYRCIVLGTMKAGARIEGFLWKDERNNKVEIRKSPKEGALEIVTEYTPLQWFELQEEGMDKISCTYLEVLLITGRSHQIRAHLASIGHPILGDGKYGNTHVNKMIDKRYGVNSQMLHAYRIESDELPESVTAPLPKSFEQLLGSNSRVN